MKPASYDLTIGGIILDDKEAETYTLEPDTTVFIKTAEELHIPDDLLGHVGEKNSRMRQGLWVSGPNYFPGHTTYAFLRVRNVSPDAITLKAGDKIAQIFFEKMDEKPEHPYNEQQGASFNDEESYRGMGRYDSEYSRRIRKAKKVNQDLDHLQGKIYANIITLMGLFVSIFSLIMVNFTSISQKRNRG